MTPLYDQSIPDRLEHLLKVMTSQRFLQMQGLNNEIPFFIFPYKPQEHSEIEKMGKNLIHKLELKGIRILKINLYDQAIKLLKGRGVFNQIIENEIQYSKKELLEDLQGVLETREHLVPAIAEEMSAKLFDILFLTGIGEVYPYIRSHNVLNNLQSVAKDHPTLLWFPGQYVFTAEGRSSLKLFNCLPDDAYYRAFNILEYQV